jgi:hypothetical protein
VVTYPNVFAAAAIQLCAALWAECDSIGALIERQDSDSSRAELAKRIEALRLELLLILDRCGGRWMIRLDPWQRAWLVSAIDALLDDLGDVGDPPELEPVKRAQNRLLDAVLEQCAEHSRGTDPAARLPEPRFANAGNAATLQYL